MRKSLPIFLGLALAVAATPLVYAQAQSFGAGHHGQHRHHNAFAQLNLSDAQKAQIKQIMQSQRGQGKAQFQAMRAQRQAFEQMAPNAPGYQAAAKQLAEAEGAALTARLERRAAIRAQVYAILTPAQQSQLAAAKAQREARHQQWEQFKAQHPIAPAPTAAS